MSARRSGPALLVGAVIGAVALAGAAACTKAQVSYGGVSCAQGKLTIDQNRTATQYPDPAVAVQEYLVDGTVPPIAKVGYEVSQRGQGTEVWVHKANDGQVDASIGVAQEGERWRVAGAARCDG